MYLSNKSRDRENPKSRKSFEIITLRKLRPYLLWFAVVFILVSCWRSASGPRAESSRLKATKAMIGLFEKPLDQYHQDFGFYPEELKHLWAPPPEIDPAAWKGPYMEGDAKVPDFWGLSDAWVHNFAFNLLEDGHACKIVSAGPDGQFGTEDDIEQTYRYREKRDSSKSERSGEP
jgi:hypothetical protein